MNWGVLKFINSRDFASPPDTCSGDPCSPGRKYGPSQSLSCDKLETKNVFRVFSLRYIKMYYIIHFYGKEVILEESREKLFVLLLSPSLSINYKSTNNDTLIKCIQHSTWWFDVILQFWPYIDCEGENNNK